MRVLVVNVGSSSVKLSLLGHDDETVAERELAAPQATIEDSDLREALSSGLGDADAVGHRVVHGGERYHAAARIDHRVQSDLRALIDLAPLHQAKSIAGIDAVRAVLPHLPAVACFDTAFHTTMSAAARTYALPSRWRERWQVRRYGFHGLSHAWVARRAPEILGMEHEELRIVSCHLGAGASLCAIAGGCSRDTTMGFTPLEGLVMATRSGSLDPGLLLWLLERTELTASQLARALEHDAGLLGLTGTADMREVLRRASADDEAAKLGLEVYVHRLRAGVAAMAASLGGIDALVFTGGVGENSAEIRARAVAGLGFLGLGLDGRANSSSSADAEISAAGSRARALVVRAREDLEIARQVRLTLHP